MESSKMSRKTQVTHKLCDDVVGFEHARQLDDGFPPSPVAREVKVHHPQIILKLETAP